MIIAFTGPRSGLSIAASEQILLALDSVVDKGEILFLHGACTGADELFHRLLTAYILDNKTYCQKYWSLEIYPSNLYHYVADISTLPMGIPVKIHPPMAPLKRNTLMARECHRLWAAPESWIRTRSGTWHTILQAEKLKKPIDYF